MKMLELNKIYCGDCVEVMKEIDDNVIDLVITSPPYDNLRTCYDFTFDFEFIAEELYRISKPGGVVVWVVGDATIEGSETGTSFRQALHFMDVGFNLHDTMIYEKTGMPFPSRNRYHQMFEYMFVFSKSKPKVFNPIKDEEKKWLCGRWGRSTERQQDGTLLKTNYTNNNTQYKMRSNIWRIVNSGGFGQKDKIAYKHPATFPEQLARDNIISWSNENDLILDPMCGSGTTCKMAKLLNRNYIGIDISEEYCNIANERLSKVNAK